MPFPKVGIQDSLILLCTDQFLKWPEQDQFHQALLSSQLMFYTDLILPLVEWGGVTAFSFFSLFLDTLQLITCMVFSPAKHEHTLLNMWLQCVFTGFWCVCDFLTAVYVCVIRIFVRLGGHLLMHSLCFTSICIVLERLVLKTSGLDAVCLPFLQFCWAKWHLWCKKIHLENCKAVSFSDQEQWNRDNVQILLSALVCRCYFIVEALCRGMHLCFI